MKPRPPQLIFIGPGLDPKHDDAETSRWLAQLRPRPSLWQRLVANFHSRKPTTMTTPDTIAAELAASSALRKRHKVELAPLEVAAADATRADLEAQNALTATRAALSVAQMGGAGDALVLFEQVERAERAALAARSQRDATGTRLFQARTTHRSESWVAELETVLGELRTHLPEASVALYHAAELLGARLDEFDGRTDLTNLTHGITAANVQAVLDALRRELGGKDVLGDGPAPRMSLVWHGIEWR
jgi:hypothetical protein